MTPDQIFLVQSTWAKVVPIKETAAMRLDELVPTVKHAWTQAYATLTGVMKDAGANATVRRFARFQMGEA